jgi:hypothetical protein
MDINLALQIGALFDGDTLGRDIAGNNRGLTQFDAIAGLNVALEFSLHHNPFGVHAGFDLAVGANRQAVAFQGDAAFDLAIHIKIFAARKFALDEDRFADLRQTAGGCAHRTLSYKCKGICRSTTKSTLTTQNRSVARCNDYTQGTDCAASRRSGYPVPCREYPEADCYNEGVGNIVSWITRQRKTPPVAVVILLFPWIAGMGAPSLAAGAPPGAAQEAASPIELVRAAVANEVAAANDTSIKHMFRSRKQTPHGSQTRLYVETREAMAGLTIAYNDQPLTPEQMQDEKSRLAGLVRDPEQLGHKHSQEQETAERTLRIVKALPEAFLYDYDGEEKGAANIGRDGGPLVHSFTPISH